MNAKHAFLALAASLSLGAAQAEPMDARTLQGWVSHAEAVFAEADAANLANAAEHAARSAWVAHAEAVFAAADAENLALANALESRAAWVAHAEAVFAAADHHNLSIARALEGAESARSALRLVNTSINR